MACPLAHRGGDCAGWHSHWYHCRFDRGLGWIGSRGRTGSGGAATGPYDRADAGGYTQAAAVTDLHQSQCSYTNRLEWRGGNSHAIAYPNASGYEDAHAYPDTQSFK